MISYEEGDKMSIEDIKRFCDLRRVRRLNKTKLFLLEQEGDIILSKNDKGDIIIAAVVQDGFVVELLADNYKINEDDLISFYQKHNLTFDHHPDISLRRYRRRDKHAEKLS